MHVGGGRVRAAVRVQAGSVWALEARGRRGGGIPCRGGGALHITPGGADSPRVLCRAAADGEEGGGALAEATSLGRESAAHGSSLSSLSGSGDAPAEGVVREDGVLLLESPVPLTEVSEEQDKSMDVQQEKGELIDLHHPALFVNREASLLQFQRRVLDEATDERLPLLERVKYCGIVGSNMDEFYMVRVGGLHMEIESGIQSTVPGTTARESLASIGKATNELEGDLDAIFDGLSKLMADEGIMLHEYTDLSDGQRARMVEYFDTQVFPVLTPLAFDPGHPFPHIPNLAMVLAVLVVNPSDGRTSFAIVPVPQRLPRFVPLKRSSGSTKKDGTVSGRQHFVWLEQLIAANLGKLFPGMDVLDAHPFRLTRNADMELHELESPNLLRTVQESLQTRRFADTVRLTVASSMPESIRKIIVRNLIADEDINITHVQSRKRLQYKDLFALYGAVLRADLKFQAKPTPSLPFTDNIFTAIRKDGPLLLHHPYDSFGPVIDFLKQASRDPNVMGIKQTLYRVGSNSPVVQALLDAQTLHPDMEVSVLVELKARFDEESNIGWAKKLEQKGVHVTYGLLGLKTHSKIAMVIREEDGKIRRYCHLSTGNYNAGTAHIYEDIGFFTDDDDIGADATQLFNYLTGISRHTDYRKLLVAPINMRQRLTALIQNETDLAKAGKPARIIWKTNSIVDGKIIRQLYRASQAGVSIDLIVRGVCCLRPGVIGVSDNIRVRSVVGQYLEHSRIYYFGNSDGETPTIYCGSADIMGRNLDRRVEVLYPIEAPHLIDHLFHKVLHLYLADKAKVRLMTPHGKYVRPSDWNQKGNVHAQEILRSMYHKARRDAERSTSTRLRDLPMKDFPKDRTINDKKEFVVASFQEATHTPQAKSDQP